MKEPISFQLPDDYALADQELFWIDTQLDNYFDKEEIGSLYPEDINPVWIARDALLTVKFNRALVSVKEVWRHAIQSIRHIRRQMVCKHEKIVGCGYGGPDSGNDDHYCKQCGKYWSVPLY